MALALFQFTQTTTGRNAAVPLIRSALAGAVNGEVRIGAILGGNLVTRVEISRFEILGSDSQPFLALDTVLIEYDPLALLRKQLRVRRIRARGLDLRLTQDAAGAWNFDRIFGGDNTSTEASPVSDPTHSDGVGPGAADALAAVPDSTLADSLRLEEGARPFRLILSDASVENGTVEVRTPWTARLEGAEREAALREARSGEALWSVHETEEGDFERSYRVENLHGSFPLLRLTDPPRPLRIQVEEASGTLYAVRRPLDLEHVSLLATFRDSVQLEIDRFETANSVVFGTGWVAPGPRLEYGFELSADPLDFEDLAWLPLPIPSSGSGPLAIDLGSRGEDMIITVSNGDMRSEDTRIEGGFTLDMGRVQRFEDLDLRLSPLRLRWLDRLLERDESIDGWVRGSVRGSGRIGDLTIAADLSLTDLEPGATPSALQARGGVSIVDPYPVRDLELGFQTFEPRWARVLGFDIPLTGRVDGSLTVDRPDGETIAFAGDLGHFTEAGDLSQVSGSGTVAFGERLVIDVGLEARPLALAAIRPWVPDIELAGSVSGPIRARGDPSDLSASATLQTERGQLTIDGSFELDRESPRYDAQIEATNLSLDQWIEGAPMSRLAVRGRIAGEGVDPATLDAAFDLEVLPSELDKAEIFDSRVRFRVADGMAAIDTLSIQSDVGSFAGRGRFGLAEGQLGTIEFEAEVGDLAVLNRWFAEEIPGGDAAKAGEDLFASFEAVLGRAAEEESTEGLSGLLAAHGVAVGRWGDFSVEAFLEGSDPRYRAYRADTLSARVELLEPPSADALVAQLTASGVNLGGSRLDSLALRLERSEPGAAVLDLYAGRDSTLELSGRGDIVAGDIWQASLERLRIRLGKLESVLTGPAHLTYSDSALVIDKLAVSGLLGRIEVDGRIPATGQGDLSLELFGIRVDQLGYLISETPEFGGTLQGSWRLTGTLDDPRFAGTARIVDPSIRSQRYSSLEARLGYSDRRIDGLIDLMGSGLRLARLNGTVRADLSLRSVERRLLDDPIDLTIRGDSLPLALIELKVQGLEEISGIGAADMTLRGSPGDLRYSGGIDVVNGRAWVPDLGVWLTEVGGRIGFRGSEARLDSVSVASDLGGSARVSGTVDIASLSDPRFDLDLTARELHAISRLDMSLAISGRGRLTGTYLAPRLSGDFRLAEGDIRQDEFLRARQIIDLTDPTIYTLLDSASLRDRRLLERFRNPFMDNLVVDASVSLGPNLWLRSPQMDVEMVADSLEVQADRSRDALAVTGLVQLQRGTYRFDRLPPYVQSLRITEGTIQFVGDPEFNPNLDIGAEYRNRTTEGPVVITTRIGGTLKESTLDISSNPPMSDSDQLCFLAVGAPCYLSADRQLGQRLLQETFLGTLSSGISSALVGSTGLSYFNLRSVGGGATLGGVQTSQSVFDQTVVEFGWYAGRDIFFSFSQPLEGSPPRATLEWTFLPNWSMEARAASRFDERLFGLARGTNLANEQTFGLFLFRTWDF